jgi:hypothetical protein
MYSIKKQYNESLENYKHKIFNYNARLKLENQNMIDFIKYTESIKDILLAQHNKKVDKRFFNKINNDKFTFYLDNDYKTLAGDLIVYFSNRITDCKYYAFGGQEKTEHNNYLNTAQYKKYFQLKKDDTSNAIFDYDLFLQGIEKLKKHIESNKQNLKNQNTVLKKAIKLNNALYDLLSGSEFLRHILVEYD